MDLNVTHWRPRRGGSPATTRKSSGDVLDPIPFEAEKFDSVGDYLLHCLPGTLEAKSVAFDHLKALMKPGAVIFGATLLQGGVERDGAEKRLMAVYNRKRIFRTKATI